MDTTSGFSGTLSYCSPERFKGDPNSMKEDLWALGVILYRLCTFEFPFKGKESAQIMHEVIYGMQQKIPKKYSKGLATIVRKLL